MTRLRAAATLAATALSLSFAAPAKAYPVDCAILLCLAGGWPASAECAHARTVFIARITPWPVEPPLQIWNCPMRASFRGETKPIERLSDIAVHGEPEPLISIPETPWALQLVQDRADVDISEPAFDFVRSIRVFEITYQQRRSSDGDCNSWGAVYMGTMGLKATTAVVEAAFLRFRPPRISPCRPTVAAIGTGRSSSNGATMKAATDTKKFTTDNLNDRPPSKRSNDRIPRNRNDARP